ncbi:MAG: DUF1573 domain-containing protein [Bacteroidales bacterium]|nr:DUF1573 domain-containing protein [Bacteroidales bacterium]MCB8999537.1 DUF1573 domain-containing protein [Bacteroidales bacterium]MCB9012958.1 DUF1573 domain-containing protein [Bacteroidales bacterium]
MMKGLFSLVILSAILLVSCGESGKSDSKKEALSKIEFASTTYDYGDIAYQSDGTCSFKFTNTSNVPLVVNVVRTSCGCTNPEWPKDPIEKGQSGEIKVTYNTEIIGKFRKSITVFCNAENSPVKLSITGDVMPNPVNASSSKQ